MARSRISEDQVIDDDFISLSEHADPLEVPHRLTMNLDFPSTYSGAAGQLLMVSDAELGLVTVPTSDLQFSSEYPRYYISEDINVSINNYGQYVIEETGYLEIAGSITLNTGSMIIIK